MKSLRGMRTLGSFTSIITTCSFYALPCPYSSLVVSSQRFVTVDLIGLLFSVCVGEASWWRKGAEGISLRR